MADREKVLKALEHHKETAVCNGCPYAGDDDTPQGNCPVYDDTIALLQEQDAIEPVPEPADQPAMWFCGKCGDFIADANEYRPKYCPECGRAVKWDDAE